MNDVINVITVILILFLLVSSVFLMYHHIFHENDPKLVEPQKTVTTETLIPTHIAKCTETVGHVCMTYTIYRVTTP